MNFTRETSAFSDREGAHRSHLPTPADEQVFDGGDDYWRKAEWHGYWSGHVVARCPACSVRQMVAYRPASAKWPFCKVCTPGTLTAGKRHGAPRVEPISDLSRVRHKRPGKPRTKAELLEDGWVVEGPPGPPLRSSDAPA